MLELSLHTKFASLQSNSWAATTYSQTHPEINDWHRQPVSFANNTVQILKTRRKERSECPVKSSFAGLFKALEVHATYGAHAAS